MRERDAAAVLSECRRLLVERAGTIVGEATGGAALDDWRHYPDGEIYDATRHTQYFYHRHPAGDRQGAEHGHFHLFLRAEGMPPRTAPLLLPELAVADVPLPTPPQAAPLKRGNRDEVSHIVAIAVDAGGVPLRLFTTNRWVTGETWYAAADVIRMAERFTAGGRAAIGGSVLDRWIGALVQLYLRDIAVLLKQRDDAVMAWRRRRRGNVFEDQRLEITSSVDIDLDARLAEIAQREAVPVPAPGRPPRLRLPPMAEGWGS